MGDAPVPRRRSRAALRRRVRGKTPVGPAGSFRHSRFAAVAGGPGLLVVSEKTSSDDSVSAAAGEPVPREIALDRPRVSGREVIFSWSVEPRSELYRSHRFSLRFPEAVDLSRVPLAFWDR